MTPDQELNEEAAIKLGAEAERVINSPAYQRAMVAMKSRVFDGFVGTKWYQRKRRDEQWRLMRVAESFEAELAQMIDDGKISTLTLVNQRK